MPVLIVQFYVFVSSKNNSIVDNLSVARIGSTVDFNEVLLIALSD